MRDGDIRDALKGNLAKAHKDDPDTLIIEELGLCGSIARVDVAVVNGVLTGFEIKSERDTLQRLPSQSDVYCRVFDFVHIVFSGRSVKAIEDAVPDWWGILYATLSAGNAVELMSVREGSRNPKIDPFGVVQLLWREEAFDILVLEGMAKGLASKPKYVLWDALASELPVERLCDHVRSKVKSRSDWRPDARPTQDGDSCRLFSTP